MERQGKEESKERGRAEENNAGGDFKEELLELFWFALIDFFSLATYRVKGD